MAVHKLFNGDTWEAASFSPTGLPAVNGKVICPASVTGNKTDASENFNDIDLDLLLTHPGFRGDFGASGAPLQGAADLVKHLGSGAFYFECTDNGAAGLTTDEVLIEAANAGVVTVLSTDATAVDGFYGTIIANRGNVTLDGSLKWAASPIVKVGSVSNVLGDVNLTIAFSALTLAKMEQDGGETHLHSIVTEFWMSAGVCFKEDTKMPTAHLSGGTLVYNDAAVAGEVLLIEVKAGATLDLMQNSVEKVLDKVVAHPGSHVLYEPKWHTITDFVDHRTRVA